jgi:hypothetical protein
MKNRLITHLLILTLFTFLNLLPIEVISALARGYAMNYAKKLIADG